MTRLEQIRNDLDNYIKKELEKSPPDRSFEVFSFEEKLCEIVDSLDEIIYFDPTPDGDSPYSDAEYIITPEERDRNALRSKQESHGRDHNIPFNWWLIMTQYIVKKTSITYKYIEAESEEQAEEFALDEPDKKTDEFEEYVEVGKTFKDFDYD